VRQHIPLWLAMGARQSRSTGLLHVEAKLGAGISVMLMLNFKEKEAWLNFSSG